MALPNFMVIGAMKCGTSTLQTQLVAQPGIFMTTPKEPNFFSDDDIYAQGMDWYLSLFKDAHAQDLTGEASTHYTKLPTHPATIARMQAAGIAPKLVYMIRNPIARAVSHYIHEWSKSNMGNDPVAAFAEHDVLVEYGRYAMQIRPFIDAFGHENIHLTSLEAMKADPQAVLEGVCAHIGAAPPVWNDTIEQQNTGAQRYRALPMQKLLVDNPVAATLRRVLVPKAVRSMIRKKRSFGTPPDLPDDLRADLATRFAQDHAELSTLFPDHPALTQCYPFLSQ